MKKDKKEPNVIFFQTKNIQNRNDKEEGGYNIWVDKQDVMSRPRGRGVLVRDDDSYFLVLFFFFFFFFLYKKQKYFFFLYIHVTDIKNKK